MRRKILNIIDNIQHLKRCLEDNKKEIAKKLISELNKQLEIVNNQSVVECPFSLEQKFEQLRMLNALLQEIQDNPICFEGTYKEDVERRNLLSNYVTLYFNIEDEINWIETGLKEHEKRMYDDWTKGIMALKNIKNVFTEDNLWHKELAKCIGISNARKMVQHFSDSPNGIESFIYENRESINKEVKRYKKDGILVEANGKKGLYEILLHFGYKKSLETLYKSLQQ